jgi:hypothetical protein
MNRTIVALLLAALATGVPAHGQPATATNPAPAKTYRNPLLPDREIADPFILRVDNMD